MAVKKLFGNIYYADFRDKQGRRKRISLHTTNLHEAQAKYYELIYKRNHDIEDNNGCMYWEDFKKKLFNFMETERSQSTVKWTKLAIRHLEEVRKPRILKDVNPNLIQTVKDTMLTNGLGEQNVNRCVQALKTAMHQAEDWQLIPKQDWTIVSKLKIQKSTITFHTNEEINKLLAACPSTDWQMVILLGTDAGLRRGEMMQLKWSDVDFNNEQIHVKTEGTEKYRYIPMTPTLKKILENAKNISQSEFVIHIGEGDHRYTSDYLTSHYKNITQKAQVPSSIHKLRDTFACQLIQNGVDIISVSKLLGISNLQTSQMYGDFIPNIIRLPERNTSENLTKTAV